MQFLAKLHLHLDNLGGKYVCILDNAKIQCGAYSVNHLNELSKNSKGNIRYLYNIK